MTTTKTLGFSTALLNLAKITTYDLDQCVADICRYVVQGVTDNNFAGFANTIQKTEGKRGDAVVVAGLLKTADSSARQAAKEIRGEYKHGIKLTKEQQAQAKTQANVVASAFVASWEAHKATKAAQGKITAEKSKQTRLEKAEATKAETAAHIQAEIAKATSNAISLSDLLQQIAEGNPQALTMARQISDNLAMYERKAKANAIADKAEKKAVRVVRTKTSKGAVEPMPIAA